MSEEISGARPDGRSLRVLLHELTTETSALLKAEVALIRSEMGQKISSAQRGAALIGAGAGAVVAGALTLVACAVLALSLVWPAWLAALVVALVLCAGGVGLALAGKRKMKSAGLKPERSLESLRGAKSMVKELRQ